MLRRLVAILLLIFVAVGDAEGVLTTACDVAAEMEQGAPQDNCHCAHAHVQTIVVAERVTRAEIPAVVAPISFVESAPPSVDRAPLLRPPRA